MATYLGLIEPTLKAVKYIYDAGKGIAENAHECRQLSEHAKLVLNLMKKQVRQSPGAKPVTRVAKLCERLVDIQRTMQGLSKKGWLQRLLWHGDISTQIRKAYDEVDRVVQILGLASSVDILRMQRENETARKRDAATAQQNFEWLLRSQRDILECLQVRPPQIEEAKLAVRKHLPYVTGSKQRQVLERGLQDLERRSQDLKTLPERFIITSLDVIVHEDLKLGSGGYSQVYMGSWHGTKVAVKILEKGLSHSLMDKEISVWKDLRHPNILAFYGACSLANPPFMVCKYKANGNVVEYLRKFPDVNRCQLLFDASLGLVYLHQNRVIHGDIKGTNILVDHAGRASLADFGLSQIKLYSSTLHAAKNSRGETQGTLRWMSPEQMLHGELSTKTDVYSFAMTIYEVFTGYPPFSGAPEHAVQRSVCGPENGRPRRPEDPHLTASGLSDAMWSIVVGCWDSDPGTRMSAKQLSRQLEELAQDFRHGVMSSGRTFARLPPPSYLQSKATLMPDSPDPPTYSAVPTHIQTSRGSVALWPSAFYKGLLPGGGQGPVVLEPERRDHDMYRSKSLATLADHRHDPSSSSRNVSNSSRTHVTRTVLRLAAEAEARSSGRTSSSSDTGSTTVSIWRHRR